jgi:hypothetical protein
LAWDPPPPLPAPIRAADDWRLGRFLNFGVSPTIFLTGHRDAPDARRWAFGARPAEYTQKLHELSSCIDLLYNLK